MLTNNGHRCDAEIGGSIINRRHSCNRRAHFTITSHIGTRLDYCTRHAATVQSPRDFRPAPFAKMAPIVRPS